MGIPRSKMFFSKNASKILLAKPQTQVTNSGSWFGQGLRGQFCKSKLAPINPTMEVAFVKHDLRNILAFWEDWVRAERPELQSKMHSHFEHHAFYTVVLACWLQSFPPQRPKYSFGHAWQKLLLWWGQLERVWPHRFDPKNPFSKIGKIAGNSIK